MHRTKQSLFIVILIALGLCACGGGMRGKINDARMGIGAGGTALDAADKVVDDLYGQAPMEDTDAYCKNKIGSLVFQQVKVILVTAADVVKLWEETWIITEANKAKGKDTSTDESNLLSSEADWMKIATEVASVLHGMWTFAKTLIPEGKIPTVVEYAVELLVSLSGKPIVEFEFNWTDLEGSVCVDYLPGGGGS